MTVASLTNRNDYVGDGATATYSYTFRVVSSAHIRVIVVDTAGSETVLTLTTHYTVTGVGAGSGGTITLGAGFAWMTAGFLTNLYTISIRRVVPLKQLTDLRNQGAFFPESHEDALDYLTFAIQQLQDEVDRSLKFSEGDYASATMLNSSVRASKFLGFDSSGNPEASTTITSPIVSAYMETVLDDTTAAAARTTLGFSGASGTVAAGNIEANAVTTVKILDVNVTTAKIADLNVTTAKIADLNVTTAKIADSNVTTAKIADLNVTQAKMAARTSSSPSAWGTPVSAGVIATSSDSGTFNGSSGTFAAVTNCEVGVVTLGRPVMVMVNGFSSSDSYIAGSTADDHHLGIQRTSDGAAWTTIARQSMARVTTPANGQISCIDVVAAGTYGYRLVYLTGGGNMDVVRLSVRAYEI